MKSLKKPIEYKTKEEIVYNEIKKAIINCELEPDTQLIIRSLATHFNVSESPVREALKRLISEDFVVEKGSNLYVSSISATQLMDMLDIRLDIEMIAIKIATIRSTKEDIEYLYEILDEMKRYYKKGDFINYDINHKELHSAMFDTCRVNYLISAVKDAYEHNQRGVNFFKLQSWNEFPSIEDHEKIVIAMEKKDAEEAQRCLLNNRKKAFSLYKQQMCKIIGDS